MWLYPGLAILTGIVLHECETYVRASRWMLVYIHVVVRIHHTRGEFFCFCSHIYFFCIFITLICVHGSDRTAPPITFMFGHMVGMDTAQCRYKCGQDWMRSN
jgi:hypothetical protein